MSRLRASFQPISLFALGVAFAFLIASRPVSAATSKSAPARASRTFAPAAHRSEHGGGGGGEHEGHGGGGGGRVFGGWGWYSPWWWGYGYYPYPYAYPYADPYFRRGYASPSRWTAVKTDVEPDEASLFLDGKLIGTADDFDGYPDMLYLGRGHYRLEFRLDGYETYSTDVEAAPGRSFRIDRRLKKIPGAKHYGTYEPARPEGGVVRYFRKRGSQTQAEAADPEEAPRGRMEATPPDGSEQPDEADQAPGDAGDGELDDRAPEASDSHLSFEVEPLDAAVYVDGHFAGGARELNSLGEGFAVPAGEHRVVVTCPGFAEKTVEVVAPARRSARVRVRLTK
ncbi:MAG: hypothetical protein ACRD16_08050 [Thermoanaerobaculia bacterium]